MGYLLGNGGFSNGGINVTIPNGQQEVLEYFNNNILNDHCLIKYSVDDITYTIKSTTGTRGIHHNNQYIKLLKKYGLYGKNSLAKFIPKNFLLASTKNRLALLRGLMDADGTSCKKGYHISYSTSSKLLAEDFKILVESLGGIAIINSKIPIYTYKKEKRIGNKTYIISVKFNNNINPFGITFKKHIRKKRTKYHLKRFIDSVEYIGTKECKCILIDHPNHLYLTNNFIATHNTTIPAYMAYDAISKNQQDKIIITRPAMNSGEELGYHPGNISDKFDPYITPIKQELIQWMGNKLYKEFVDNNKIQYIPLAYTRGLNYHDSFIICEEAQNLTKSQLILLLTRIGKNSKCILCGDISQADFKYQEQLNNLAFSYAFDMLYDIDKIGLIEFTTADIVRNDLIAKILQILT